MISPAGVTAPSSGWSATARGPPARPPRAAPPPPPPKKKGGGLPPPAGPPPGGRGGGGGGARPRLPPPHNPRPAKQARNRAGDMAGGAPHVDNRREAIGHRE